MNKFSKTILYASLALLIAPKAYADNINMNTAHLQAMDKITGSVSELNIPVNGLANFGTFSILVRKCVTKSPEETPENTAFIDIVDNYKSQNPINIFKGWMFSSTPGINGVEHPIYDIWLLKCYNSDGSKHQVLNEEQLKFRDELPMVRQEKPKQNVKLSALDEIPTNDIESLIEKAKELDKETSSTKSIEENTPTQENDSTVIKIDVDEEISLPKTDNSEKAVEEEFAAEGEETVAETIIVDNATVAQDEKNQKINEETADTTTE